MENVGKVVTQVEMPEVPMDIGLENVELNFEPQVPEAEAVGLETGFTTESEEVQLENVREELSFIEKEDEVELQEEGPFDELAYIDMKIAILTAERDRLREMLGISTMSEILKIVKFFFTDTFKDDLSGFEDNKSETIIKDESAMTELRKIETELEDLKEYRKKFLANSTT